MPPEDPGSCPALERTMPEDAAPGGEYVEPPRGAVTDVLFGDTSKRRSEVSGTLSAGPTRCVV